MIEIVLFAFSVLNTAYVLGMAIAGHFYKKKPIPPASGHKRIAVLVPCYKEDGIILNTTAQFLSQDYPSDYYDVIIIADSFRPATLDALAETRAIVIPVSFENSMKSKALNYAMNHLERDYDIAVVADADNILSKTFLSDINSLFEQGYEIIQAQRTAKNADTPMAVLDGLSEAINNHQLRQAPNALGLSSALIGSGMSFPFGLLKEEMAKINTPVEDKALQIALVAKGHTIYYRKDILVLDEKVATPEAYKNQRRRWIGGQYSMLKKNFFKSFRLLFKGNLNFFNIAFLQNFLPSRINSIIYLMILCIVFTFVPDDYSVTIRWWLVAGCYFLGLALSTPRHLYTMNLVRSLLIMPMIVLKTIQAIFLSRSATKSFIHTQHVSAEANLQEKS